MSACARLRWPGSVPGRGVILALGIALPLFGGCEEPGPPVIPTAEQAAAYYNRSDLVATVNGNVVTLTVRQSSEYLRRGGSLWAKSTPYLFLFSTPTSRLFADYPDLAGVRVVTELAGGEEVARALLRRDALNGITWRHALAVGAVAMTEGTRSPRKLRELVDYGEDLVEFSYNPKYAGSSR